MSETPLPREDAQEAEVAVVSTNESVRSLVPVMALSIPILGVSIPLLAVAGSIGVGGVVVGIAGAVVVLVLAASLLRGVLEARHKQRMAELRLQLEIARQDTAKLAEVNRIVD